MTNPEPFSPLEELSNQLLPASLTDWDFRCRTLLYGDIGAGKTDLGIHIANTLGDRILLTYTDSGWSTVLKYPEIKKKVDFLPFGGLSTIVTFLDGRERGIEPWCNYDVLQWDTTSTSADLTLRRLVSKRKFPKDQYASDMEGRPHYRLLELNMKELIDRLNKSNLHIIYTAHLRFPTEKDIEQQKIAVRPNFPEATYRVLARECNMVGYMYSDDPGEKRYIQLRGTRTVTAKSQIPNIPERIYRTDEITPLLDDWINKR